MAVSGLPEPCRSHARCIARLALDMMDLAANEVQIDGEPVVSRHIFYATIYGLEFLCFYEGYSLGVFLLGISLNLKMQWKFLVLRQFPWKMSYDKFRINFGRRWNLMQISEKLKNKSMLVWYICPNVEQIRIVVYSTLYFLLYTLWYIYYKILKAGLRTKY